MKELVFFLEEPSAAEFLKEIIKKIAIDPEIHVRYIVFKGKSDLKRNIQKKLTGWTNKRARFIIIHDKDSSDCKELKREIQNLCNSTQKIVKVRIACGELESFYLGDLQAVETAFNIDGLCLLQSKKKFRDPDSLGNPVQVLSQITNYRYHKILGSREISKHLSVTTNKSRSFKMLIGAIQELCLFSR